jgi:protein TonB
MSLNNRTISVQALILVGRLKRHLDSVLTYLDLRIRVPEFYTRMDFQSQVMTLAVGASVLLHTAILLLHFSFPDHSPDVDPGLEVVLVNSKSSSKPFFADALAQANLDGGGNTDKKRRAKTPLPALHKTEKGDSLTQAVARQKELEAEQQRLLSALNSPVALPLPKTNPVDTPIPQQSGADLSTSALAIAKLEAQIAQEIEEYQQRPRKEFIGARASEYRFAQYVDDWRIKVERVGNLNYPEAAKGRYGSLRFTVTIRANGTIDNIFIDRSSGSPVLDEAARKILRMAAPYAVFPPNIRDRDMLVITRTMTFSPGDRVSSE